MTLSLGSDDRAYLVAGRSGRYALGDPDAPDLVLNAADTYGCLWAADVPDGWDAPDVSTPLDRRPAGHGGYAGEPTFEPRTLTIEGLVTAPSATALDGAEQRWRTALLGALPAMTRYSHLDDDPPRGLWVYPVGKPRWRALDDRVAEFAAVLVAEDPIKTGFADLYGPLRLPAAGGEGGYAMPLTAPATAAGGSSSVTVAVVRNDGDEAAHSIFTVTGPVLQPVIRLGTGEYVHLAADLAALDVWTVDTAAGTSTVNGVNRYDAWGSGSTFPLIPAGGTEVRLRSVLGDSNQDAALNLLTASAWK